MGGNHIVASALKLQVTAALGGHETTGDTVFIEQSTIGSATPRLAKIADEIKADLSPLLNRVAHTLAYSAAQYGDAYARLYPKENVGIVDICTDELLNSQLIQPFERGSKTMGFIAYIGKNNFQRLDIAQIGRVKMPRQNWIPQYGVVEKSLRTQLANDDYDSLEIMPSMVGGSLLANSETSYDNLVASLLGLVGQRWLDSIDEQILTVNTESMTKDQRTVFIKSVVDMLKSTRARAEKAIQDGQPVMERIRHIMPVFNEKQLTTLSPSNGGASNRGGSISIDDVMLHARMLAGDLGIDLSMLGFADLLSGGMGDGGFFRMSAQAAENSRVIRIALSDFYYHVIDIHTLYKYGIVFEHNERPFTINFYGSISALESERQKTKADAMNSGMMNVQAMQMFKDMGADVVMMETFLSKTLMMNEDIAKVYAQIVKQPAAAPEGME